MSELVTTSPGVPDNHKCSLLRFKGLTARDVTPIRANPPDVEDFKGGHEHQSHRSPEVSPDPGVRQAICITKQTPSLAIGPRKAAQVHSGLLG